MAVPSYFVCKTLILIFFRPHTEISEDDVELSRKQRHRVRFLFPFTNATMLTAAVLLSYPVLAACEKKPPADTAASDTFRALIPPTAKPRLIHDGASGKPGLTFTEGPAWMNGRLYFSNYYMFWKPFGSIEQGGPMVIEPDGTVRILDTTMQTCGMTALKNGNLGVCDLIGSRVMEMSPEGKFVRVLADRFEEIGLDGPNDLVVDAKGGIYFSDPQSSKKKKKTLPGTAIFYINPQGTVVRVSAWNEFSFPNGCILSPDGGTFYLNDSGSDFMWAFTVKPDGTLANKREFARLVPPKGGKPGRSNADGMTVDTRGNIYVTAYGSIQVIDSAGNTLGYIKFPKSPSNCIFGGKDMKTLYATCRDCIYALDTNVTGLAYPPR